MIDIRIETSFDYRWKEWHKRNIAQFPPLSMTETVNSIKVKKHPFLTAYMTLWGPFWSAFESVYSNYIPAGVVYKLSQL